MTFLLSVTVICVSQLSFDPIAEAHRQWLARWPEQADRMAAVTSVMRAQQVLLTEIERILRPYDLTFASYEALQLLALTRAGQLPMGKIGERLMVHPTSVTNTIDRLERRALVKRQPAPEDRRRVLAEITPLGREVVARATTDLHNADFGIGLIDNETTVGISRLLRKVRLVAGDFPEAAHDPWSSAETLDGR
jgi:DNA-binding MarR family transcriptional regulator